MVSPSDPKAVHTGALPERRKPWTCPTCHGVERSDGTYAQPPADPTLAARERLGAWLSAEPCRAWERYGDPPSMSVGLWDHADNWHRAPDHVGTGHDLASAILAALDAANGGDRG